MEIEIKLLLSADDAARLRTHLGAPHQAVRQRNTYYDDEERNLGRAGWGLRLREESSVAGERAWLTLKHRGETFEGFAHRPEYDRELDPRECALLREDPPSLLRAARELVSDPEVLPESGLVELGEIVNHRERYPLPGAEELVLEHDHTLWPDGSETHELELEVLDGSEAGRARERLAALLDGLSIEWRVGRESKLARLVRMLDA